MVFQNLIVLLQNYLIFDVLFRILGNLKILFLQFYNLIRPFYLTLKTLVLRFIDEYNLIEVGEMILAILSSNPFGSS